MLMESEGDTPRWLKNRGQPLMTGAYKYQDSLYYLGHANADHEDPPSSLCGCHLAC